MITQTLKELERLPQAQYWNVSPRVGRFLFELTAALQSRNILEVGTSNGYSALWFCQSIKLSGGHLWTIESHKERFAEATDNFQKSGVAAIVTQVKGHAPEIIQEIKGLPPLDFVFLDATKGEYSQHLQGVLNLLGSQGVILADNVQSHWDQLVECRFFELVNSLPGFSSYLAKDFGTGMLLLAPQNLSANIEQVLSELTGTRWCLGPIVY